MTPSDRDPHAPGGTTGSCASIHTVLCDLDGVVWLARRAIPGAVEAINEIRASGRRVLFVTNNSVATEDELVEALAAIDVAARGDVVTSAMAAAMLIDDGSRVLVAGASGVVEAVERRGGEAIPNDGSRPTDGVDAVVVGLHRDFDYARLRRASAAIRAGARYIATNDDATFPTPTGLDPGGGSIVAAVTTAAGTEPVIAGKPHRPMADYIAGVLEPSEADPSRLLMVGDRPSTDGRFAEALGCRFALVRTGVVAPERPAPTGTPIAFDEPDLAALARMLAGEPIHRQGDDHADALGHPGEAGHPDGPVHPDGAGHPGATEHPGADAHLDAADRRDILD
jgi:4-nitrophenyl phosphatase